MHVARSLVIAAILVLGVAACGDGAGDDAEGTTSPTPTSTPAVDPPDGAPDDDETARCAEAARSVAELQAYDAFPDNPDVTWTTAEVVATADRAIAEMVPSPDEVGYPPLPTGVGVRGGRDRAARRLRPRGR